MATHRYWRIAVTNTHGDNVVSLEEVEFRATAGGADLTGSGAALGTNNVGYAPSGAFDNNAVTIWAASASLGAEGGVGDGNSSNHMAWVGYDFGAGTPVDVREVLIQSRAGFAGQAPKNILIQFSDDATLWITAETFWDIPAWSALGEARIYTIPEWMDFPYGARRYWRIQFSDSNGDTYIAIPTADFHDKVGGRWLSFAGTASHGHTVGGTAADSFDGYSGSLWAGNKTTWIQFDFGAGVKWEFAELAILSRASPYQAQAPKDFIIQASDDGSTWEDRATISGETGWGAGGEWRYFPITALEPPAEIEIAGTLPAFEGSMSITFDVPVFNIAIAGTLPEFLGSMSIERGVRTMGRISNITTID